MDEACHPWFAVKMLKWGSVLMWGGSVCHDPFGPPVNLWTADTVVQQTVQSVTVWSLCDQCHLCDYQSRFYYHFCEVWSVIAILPNAL